MKNRYRACWLVLGLGLSNLLYPGAGVAKTLQISPPGDGQVRALVIGIDRYQDVDPLQGAVADAQDIASALKNAGVSDLTVLTDGEATRHNIESAMMGIAAATPGDLVFMSIAGHGAQAPEQVKGSEPDGMDEIFLLAGFSRSGRGNAERIVDNEFNGWLAQLNRKGVDVLFVADVCHGGGMTRQPKFGSETLRYRFAGTVQLNRGNDTPLTRAANARVKPRDLPHVTFIAGVDKYKLVPEVTIPGTETTRGALSYAVARAIDAGRDGPITRQHLFGFSRQIALQYSQGQQSIVAEPQGADARLDQVVFRLKTDGVRTAPERAIPIRLLVMDGDAAKLNGVAPNDAPFRLVKVGKLSDLSRYIGQFDLFWSADKGEIYSAAGDLIGSARAASDIPPIVDLVSAMTTITKLTAMNYQSIELLPNNSRHRKGDVVSFRASGLANKHLILFDLFGDGTVRFLYPRDGSDDPLIADDSFSLPLRVGPPFGSDYVTAIVSETRLEGLEQSIRALDGQKSAGKLVDLLIATQQSHPDMRVGTAALFTSP